MTNQSIRFIRKREVMHMTGLPSSTIYDLMNRDLFPKSIKLAGGKAVAWSLSSIEAWQKQCLANQEQATV
jgi:prophage regulatory protein